MAEIFYITTQDQTILDIGTFRKQADLKCNEFYGLRNSVTQVTQSRVDVPSTHAGPVTNGVSGNCHPAMEVEQRAFDGTSRYVVAVANGVWL